MTPASATVSASYSKRRKASEWSAPLRAQQETPLITAFSRVVAGGLEPPTLGL